jgi:hypothetical protein
MPGSDPAIDGADIAGTEPPPPTPGTCTFAISRICFIPVAVARPAAAIPTNGAGGTFDIVANAFDAEMNVLIVAAAIAAAFPATVFFPSKSAAWLRSWA